MTYADADLPSQDPPAEEPEHSEKNRVVIFPGVNIRQVARMLKFLEWRDRKASDEGDK